MTSPFPTREEYLAKLEARRKPVLDLWTAGGLTVTQIAQQVGMTVPQVRNVLRTEKMHARKVTRS